MAAHSASALSEGAAALSAGHCDGEHAAPLDPQDRIRDLERQVENLERALQTQRLIGTLIGILAHRYGCTTDESWALVLRISQHTNIKVREVARVFVDACNGRAQPEDAALLAQLATQLPAGRGRSTDGAGNATAGSLHDGPLHG
jgi:hypothetical protein